MLESRTGRATARLGALATTAALTLAPLAAFAQAAPDFSDTVGKPFPLWVFLIPVAGVLALVAALIAKGAVERR